MNKLTTTIATLTAVLSIGVAAAPAHAKPVTAHPTGNKQQDEYCRGVADLINDALANRDSHDVSSSEWVEWNDLAREFQARASDNGCSFAIKAKRPQTHTTKAATATARR
jgi:hypothetical protein